MFYRIKRFIRRLRPEIVQELFYEHQLDVIAEVKPKLTVELLLLQEEDIFRVSEVRKMSVELLKKRLKNGDKCFVTEKDGRLLSYHWLQTKGKHYVQQTDKWELIDPRSAVVYHVRVHKDFRGNRINRYVYSEILKYCKEEGMNRVWIYTNKKNISNRKGLESLGFNIFKQSTSLKFKNKYYLMRLIEL